MISIMFYLLLKDSRLSTSKTVLLYNYLGLQIEKKINIYLNQMFPPPQRSRLDTVGFIRELLPAAEGRHRAGLHARADRCPGPAVLPLLHPLAAGQDHRGGSQQGAALFALSQH